MWRNEEKDNMAARGVLERFRQPKWLPIPNGGAWGGGITGLSSQISCEFLAGLEKVPQLVFKFFFSSILYSHFYFVKPFMF